MIQRLIVVCGFLLFSVPAVALQEYNVDYGDYEALTEEGYLEPSPAYDVSDPARMSALLFNLGDDGYHPINSFRERINRIAMVVRGYGADVILFQQVDSERLALLEASFPQYDIHGVRGVGADRKAYNPIFYRRDRFSRDDEKFGIFWYTDSGARDTPNEVCTWALLRTGPQPFFVYNASISATPGDREARIRATSLIWRNIKAHQDIESEQLSEWDAAAETFLSDPFKVPVILGLSLFEEDDGTMPPLRFLSGSLPTRIAPEPEFVDTLLETDVVMGAQNTQTYHNYEGMSFRPGVDEPTQRTEFLMVQGAVRSILSEVISWSDAGLYPSDRFPVYSQLEFTNYGPDPLVEDRTLEFRPFSTYLERFPDGDF